MLPGRQLLQPLSQENPLWLSWHDTQMMASLSPANVLDYFCRKSNPFYDRMCNNENVRMQRLDMETMKNMVGVEYILLHVLEPILYVIRKQHRHSVTETSPISDYYIIAGTVYKAPDLASVINSRILTTTTNLQQALEEAYSYARYHPNKGYTWDFTTNKLCQDKDKIPSKKDNYINKDEGTVFHMQRVDMLLAEMLRKFPPPLQTDVNNAGGIPGGPPPPGTNGTTTNSEMNNQGQNPGHPGHPGVGQPMDINQDGVDMKPPPEKKHRQ